jgi:hypothetical protein
MDITLTLSLSLLGVALLCLGLGIGFLAGLWFCLKSPYAKHALAEAMQESIDEEGLELMPKRVRMPWEGDETTFNVVRRNTDDGQG